MVRNFASLLFCNREENSQKNEEEEQEGGEKEGEEERVYSFCILFSYFSYSSLYS